MDIPKGSKSGSGNPIAACISMLSLRHFSAVRDFARSLPSSDSLSRILAIADVLSAADFYSVLQLRRTDGGNRDLLLGKYAKLALLLDPTSADKFPFSDEALARVQEAWRVLSNAERRAVYDSQLTTSFWTGCPYCWNLYEYEIMYQDCTLKCQGCRKTFHGVAVKPPVKMGATMVEGEGLRQYYTYNASVPLKYYEVNENENEGFQNNIFGEQQRTNYVYISDDDDDDDFGGGLGDEYFGKKVDVRNGGVEFQDNGKRKMRVKTVAKRVPANRTRRNFHANSDLGLDLDAEDGELEFTEGDDDVFIGVRFDD